MFMVNVGKYTSPMDPMGMVDLRQRQPGTVSFFFLKKTHQRLVFVYAFCSTPQQFPVFFVGTATWQLGVPAKVLGMRPPGLRFLFEKKN